MKTNLEYPAIGDVLTQRVPELTVRIQKEFGDEYDFDTEKPGAYLLFEDVVQPFLYENLEMRSDEHALLRLFSLFEDMANSSDPEVVNLLRVGVLEALVPESLLYESAQQYMGQKTAEYAASEKSTTVPGKPLKAAYAKRPRQPS